VGGICHGVVFKEVSKNDYLWRMKWLNSIFICLLIIFSAESFAQVQLALDDSKWKGVEAYEVKGRNGILIKQKLSFGNYFTTSVNRSWTKGYSSFDEPGRPNPSRQIISNEYVEKNQTLFFAFEDSSRLKADVHCVTNFVLNDVIVGKSGINLAGLLGNISSSKSLFYIQIYTSADGAPWHLALDNIAAQESPKTYSARLARSKDEYYTLVPYRMVKNNKGKVTALTFGSAGFEIKNRQGVPVAAVCTINKGIVYLRDLPKQEQLLLAAACAAILLEEQIQTQ
jgi:hypothetical protein